MAFNITDITSALNKTGGVAKQNLFYVQITPPKNLLYASYTGQVPFFCSDAVLPGLVYSTTPVKLGGYGVHENRPTDINFNEVTLTFMVDNDAKVIDYFHKWSTLIHNFSVDTTGVQRGSSLKYGEFAYPETYESPSIGIYFLNPSADQIIKYSLDRAFPMQIGSVPVGWEMNDTIARLPVTFAYKTWDSEGIPATEMDSLEAERAMNAYYASQRFNYGGAFAFGLNLLQNGRKSPLALISGVNAFATSLR